VNKSREGQAEGEYCNDLNAWIGKQRVERGGKEKGWEGSF